MNEIEIKAAHTHLNETIAPRVNYEANDGTHSTWIESDRWLAVWLTGWLQVTVVD